MIPEELTEMVPPLATLKEAMAGDGIDKESGRNIMMMAMMMMGMSGGE